LMLCCLEIFSAKLISPPLFFLMVGEFELMASCFVGNDSPLAPFYQPSPSLLNSATHKVTG
jgi:hypothetical protein